jgi:hypothetical protein
MEEDMGLTEIDPDIEPKDGVFCVPDPKIFKNRWTIRIFIIQQRLRAMIYHVFPFKAGIESQEERLKKIKLGR